MAASGTFDPKRAQELYDDGYGCNAIARKLGCAPSTVSRWAKDAGLPFDHRQTELAVRAHVVDMAASRLLLAQKMQVVAHDLLDRIDEPYLVYSFGGRDNDYNEHTLMTAPVEVRRNIMATAGIAFDKATKVIEAAGSGTDEKASMLQRLAEAMGVKGPLDAEGAADAG